jgi:hypothetical protein
MKVACAIVLAAVLCVSVAEAVPMGRLGVKRVECHLSYFTCDNCVGYQTEMGYAQAPRRSTASIDPASVADHLPLSPRCCSSHPFVALSLIVMQ